MKLRSIFRILNNNILKDDVLKFQQECYANYLADIRKEVSDFPDPYLFPDGNPILPVMPVKTAKDKLMFVGAFPSARFEKRDGLLIPVANNLSPFGKEEYFDGQQIRKQASREVLDNHFFNHLGVDADEHWITDLVKVYLMPDAHVKNCSKVNPDITFTNTHKKFKKIAKASMDWFQKEVAICKPKLIVTFGEIVARVIEGDNETKNAGLLNGNIKTINIAGKDYLISHLPHPEIVRRDEGWADRNSAALASLAGILDG